MENEKRLLKIVERARRLGHIRGGLVTCDNCDNPASMSLSLALSWVACGPCATGEASSLDPDDFIAVAEGNTGGGRT